MIHNKKTPATPKHEPHEPDIRTEAQFTDRGAAPAGSNRRRHPRFAVEMDVSIGSEHNFYAGLAVNLSAGGVFVATHLLKPIGEVIEFSIRVPESDETVRGHGVVRWIRDYNEQSDAGPGMGIQFETLEGDSRNVIERFLSRREPLLYDEA